MCILPFTLKFTIRKTDEYAGDYHKMMKIMFMVSVTHPSILNTCPKLLHGLISGREKQVLASFRVDYIFVLRRQMSANLCIPLDINRDERGNYSRPHFTIWNLHWILIAVESDLSYSPTEGVAGRRLLVADGVQVGLELTSDRRLEADQD